VVPLYFDLRASVGLQPPGPKCVEHAKMRTNQQNLLPARIHLRSLVALDVVAVAIQLPPPSQRPIMPALPSKTADLPACHVCLVFVSQISAQPHTATQPVAGRTPATTGTHRDVINTGQHLFYLCILRSSSQYLSGQRTGEGAVGRAHQMVIQSHLMVNN
jgi:hypothetical protein